MRVAKSMAAISSIDHFRCRSLLAVEPKWFSRLVSIDKRKRNSMNRRTFLFVTMLGALLALMTIPVMAQKRELKRGKMTIASQRRAQLNPSGVELHAQQ
jgi:hypothetical protein